MPTTTFDDKLDPSTPATALGLADAATEDREHWRRVFAGQALQGICAADTLSDPRRPGRQLGALAVRMAEALCDALGIGQPATP